jgi:hypothetical protein
MPEVNEMPGISEFRDLKLPVIIFGAAVAGEAVFHACREAGIDIAAFCDNNLDKARHPCCGLEVIHFLRLKERFPDAVFLISVIDIQDIVKQLSAMGYEQFYPVAPLLRSFNVFHYEYSKPADFVNYVISACILSQDNYYSPEKIYIRSVDIVITERCSLKCRDCSNLMQYYRKPVHYKTENLLEWLDVFCEAVDEINEFRVIGGEPFMHRDWLTVTRRLIAEPKVKKVVIYTNATILPGDEQMAELRNPKVLFIVTDYGKLSRKLHEMIQKLEEMRIAHVCSPAGGWTDCAAIGRHGRTMAQLKEIFSCCCVKNSYTLMNGRLYRCPFAANVDNLKAMPDVPGDYVGLSGESSREVVKEQIRALIHDKEYIAACDFCRGRRLGDPQIPPAVQTALPLDYKRYS